MTNREWILSELAKLDNNMLAAVFCGRHKSCLDCPISIDEEKGCRMMGNVDGWMQKEHVGVTE